MGGREDGKARMSFFLILFELNAYTRKRKELVGGREDGTGEESRNISIQRYLTSVQI